MPVRDSYAEEVRNEERGCSSLVTCAPFGDVMVIDVITIYDTDPNKGQNKRLVCSAQTGRAVVRALNHVMGPEAAA